MTTYVHSPKNTYRIDSLWVWLSVDSDGNEGLVARMLDGVMMPLVTGDPRHIEALDQHAKEVSRLSKLDIRRVRFERVAEQ